MKLTVHPIQTGSGERPYDPFNASVPWLFLLKVSTAGMSCDQTLTGIAAQKRSSMRYSISVGVSARDVRFDHRTPIQNDALK